MVHFLKVSQWFAFCAPHRQLAAAGSVCAVPPAEEREGTRLRAVPRAAPGESVCGGMGDGGVVRSGAVGGGTGAAERVSVSRRGERGIGSCWACRDLAVGSGRSVSSLGGLTHHIWSVSPLMR